MAANKHITVLTKTNKKALLRFYQHNRYSARFIGFDQAYYCTDEKQNIRASVIVSKISNDNSQWLLHALLTDKSYQQQGLASALIKYCQNHHQPLVCFVDEKLTTFYYTRHFKKIPSTQLSPALQTRYFAYLTNKPTLIPLLFET